MGDLYMDDYFWDCSEAESGHSFEIELSDAEAAEWDALRAAWVAWQKRLGQHHREANEAWWEIGV